MPANARFFRFVRFPILFLFICGAACLTGCTTPGSSIEVKQAPTENLKRYQTVVVDVANRDADFTTNDVIFLGDSLVNDLRKSGRFDKVYDSATPTEHPADLKLSVLVDFVVLYNVKSIESSVTLTDTANGKMFATAQINSHSESAFLGGHMTNAITQLSSRIVGFATQR